MPEETPYERYLNAGKILSFQKGEDELVVDGERDFQGVQQESELIWSRIIPMLRRTESKVKSGDLAEATHLLEQAAMLWSGLTSKTEELLWRLWPGDFLKIRKVIGAGGSTADSPRYHQAETIARGLWAPYEHVLQRRSVALKKLLMGDPKLLILDEPTAALAPLAAEQLFTQLASIRKEIGVTLVLVEQNARKALALANRGLVLIQGKSAFEGTPDQISNDKDIIRLFLGELSI